MDAVICPDCDGWGQIMVNCMCPEGQYSTSDPHEWESCQRCKGAGKI